MIHQTVGFAVKVAAAAGRAIGTVRSDVVYVRSPLLVTSGSTAMGIGFVVYSLLSCRAGDLL